MTLFEQFECMVSHITYKPGWTFKVLANDYCAAMLKVSFKVPSVVDNSIINVVRETALSFDTINEICSHDGKERLLYIIQECVKDMELHEMAEWLKYEGEYITDPHPELRKTDEQRKRIA